MNIAENASLRIHYCAEASLEAGLRDLRCSIKRPKGENNERL